MTRGQLTKFASLNDVIRLERRRDLHSRCLCSRDSVAPMSSGLGNNVKAGKLTFTQHKGRNRKPKKLVLPILPALQTVIDASPCGDLTFLVNDFGKPFTDAGFGNKMRKWCDQAGLRHCSAHGVRKAGATIAAENGHHQTTHGDLRLGVDSASGNLYARRRTDANGCRIEAREPKA